MSYAHAGMDALLDYDSELLSPPWGSLGRSGTLGVVSALAKLLLNVLNTTRVANHDTLLDLVYQRAPGVGLLTVSNHTSTFDDPGLPCAMLPASFFWTEHAHHKNRWTMCASDICFTNELLRQFFLNGKTLPVERGGGVAQPNIGVVARALAGGAWLHIYPEGRVTPDGSVGPFRDPIILPYFHSGMARVMPFKASLPRLGNTVSVAVGRPVDLGHITCRCNQSGEDQQQVWRDIAAALHEAVVALEDQVPPNPNQVAERPDVAAYEAAFQERLRQRRAAAAAAGDRQSAEPALRQAHGSVQQLQLQQLQQQDQVGGEVAPSLPLQAAGRERRQQQQQPGQCSGWWSRWWLSVPAHMQQARASTSGPAHPVG